MSTTTDTRASNIADTTGSVSRLRSVPDQETAATGRTDAEDKLWEALHANPNSTSSDLSTAATIGKSTAGKILAKWEGEGSVTRTPRIAEGGRRAADVWAITQTETVDIVAETDSAPADERSAENTVLTDSRSDESNATPGDPEPVNTANAAGLLPVEVDVTASAEAEPTATPAPDAPQDTTNATDAAVPDTTEPTDATPVSTDDRAPADDSMPDAAPSAGSAAQDGASQRLAPGALRGLVEDHLRDHPDEPFSPTKIAQALGGKSSGAVSNALDKLVADGVAVKTQDRPRRFQLTPMEQAAAAAPAN